MSIMLVGTQYKKNHNPYSQINDRVQCCAMGLCKLLPLRFNWKVQEKKNVESSRKKSACDEDTHRVECNYKERGIKKTCFSTGVLRAR